MTRAWEDEPGALERVARRAGCRLVRRRGVAGELVAELECPSRWATVALLDELAWEDSRDPELGSLARSLERTARREGVSVRGYVLRWVQERVRFVPERVETFMGWRRVLEHGGDCDDSARLIVAILRALGLRARLITIGDPPIHVAAQSRVLGRGWVWMEATLPARLGEHPRDACERLGIPVRTDLAG